MVGYAILCLAFIVVVIVAISFFVSLIAVLPPVAWIARRSPRMRRIVCIDLGIFGALVVFALFSRLFVSVVLHDYAWLPVDNGTFKFEVWLRLIARPVFSGHCISGNAALCQLADEYQHNFTLPIPIYLLCLVLPGLVAALASWGMALGWAEPYRDEATNPWRRPADPAGE
jgi:hypothetical protein